MRLSRRQLLLQSLFGTGYLGLRALATGLPLALLANPRAARADAALACGDSLAAQFLILSMSLDGDPLNANSPGTYDVPGVVHPSDPAMAPTPLRLGSQTVTAAKPWSTLPQKLLDRACFFHHASRSNAHPNLPEVLRLQGSAQAELLPVLIGRYTSNCLGTAQREPLVVGAEPVISVEGKRLPSLKPTLLRDALLGVGTPLSNLSKVRDESLERLQQILRERGDKALHGKIEDKALSQRQAQALGEQLKADLATITSDGIEGQLTAAVLLCRLGVAPVFAIHIGFGGDNHFDYGLKKESEGTVSGVAHIAQLFSKLGQYGLGERVTFALLNAFGRTLKKRGVAGREHWGSHSTGLLIGKAFRPGIVGGLTAGEGDFVALPIDSQSGRGGAGGDIAQADTLASLGKTLARGVGLPADLIDQCIPSGKVVRAALVRP